MAKTPEKIETRQLYPQGPPRRHRRRMETTPVKLKRPAISEAAWQRTVIQCAKAFGWLVAHFRPAMNSRGKWRTPVSADGAGFPDLVLCHPISQRVLFVELKREDGRLTEDQKRWLAALGGEVWKPSHFELIRERLQLGARV